MKCWFKLAKNLFFLLFSSIYCIYSCIIGLQYSKKRDPRVLLTIFWYVKVFYHQGLHYVMLVWNSTLLQGNFHWKNWMTSKVKDLLHMTEELNWFQKFGASVGPLFCVFPCKYVRMAFQVCIRQAISHEWFAVTVRKPTAISRMLGSFTCFMMKAKKKNTVLLIRSLEHIQIH